MTREEFEMLVKDVLEKFPEQFTDKFQNVEFVVEEKLDMDMVKGLGLSGRGRLLGLYQGVPLKSRTIYYGMVLPDKITLFKRNIERVCETKGLDIYEEVKHVMQHEIAHHFGISDEHLKDLGVY